MVLEKLSDALKNTLQKIAKSIFVDDKLNIGAAGVEIFVQ